MKLVFEDYVLSSLFQNHPIIEAARVSQWLISIHFFEDGNGRTARLVGDWLLLKSGFLPVSYPNDISSFIGIDNNQKRFNHNDAVIRVCEGVENSLRVIKS